MEPRRPKHLQQPLLVVAPEEIERALQQRETYAYAIDSDDDNDLVFPRSTSASSAIDVIHTHMSMVFLLPQRVYKVKKAVDFGFADFSTLTKRFQACFAEVQLNKRLAPDVYVGVVPISMHRATRRVTLRCDDYWTPERGARLDYWLNDAYGEIVEWAVHMVRLPDDHTLEHLLRERALTQPMLAEVAQMLVAFHTDARRSAAIDAFGDETVIRANIDQNFDQTQTHVGVTVRDAVYSRVRALTYAQLDTLAPVIAARVANGYICDSHGDLRLEHVYVDPSRRGDVDVSAAAAPHKFVVLDCIEFNEQFRYGDPLADVAFLVMDIWHQGRPDLARFLQREYLRRATQDTPEHAALCLFYAAYRAVVRAKVTGFRAFDASLSVVERECVVALAQSYWLVALTLLAPPAERPCLLLVGGLPASGKSTLAKMLAGDEQTLTWLRADVIRKELVSRRLGAAVADSDGAESNGSSESADPTDLDAVLANTGSFEEGLYSPAVTQRTYDEILIRALGHLRLGERVVVDATFRDRALRDRFIAAAHAEGALFALVLCVCDREITRGRLLARKNDVSDATWDVYEAMEATWDAPTACAAMPECFVVNTEKEQELTLRRTNGFLRSIGLL